MKKFELIPASRATRNGTNKTSSSGDENASRALRFADHVTKRNGGSGDENAVVQKKTGIPMRMPSLPGLGRHLRQSLGNIFPIAREITGEGYIYTFVELLIVGYFSATIHFCTIFCLMVRP